MAATIQQLGDELVGLIKTAPTAKRRAYSVFNTDELGEIGSHVGFPIAGVSYEGKTKQENAAHATARVHKSVMNTVAHFMIVVAISYKYASDKDSKPVATDLLDEILAIVLGYHGVNNRPWVYTGELPLETDLEGVIMYGQMWETIIPAIGNSPT